MDYYSTEHYQMDETEDEEVKRNCYGKKLKYESSSDESDSDSDNETEDRSVMSIFFLFCFVIANI